MLIANAREEARLIEALKNQQIENRYETKGFIFPCIINFKIFHSISLFSTGCRWCRHLFRRFCKFFSESFPGCWAFTAAAMLPKQAWGTLGKHITKPSEQVAAPPSMSVYENIYLYLSEPILSPGRFSAAAADKVRLLEELELAQKRESHQLQDELRQRSGDAEAKRVRAASDLEVAVEKIRILEAEVSGLV